jgi:hypothetical protein
MCRCFYCILTYIPSDICPREVSPDHMGVLFLVVFFFMNFHRVYTHLYSHQQCIKGYSAPISLPAFVFLFFLIAILTQVRWNLNVVLICISFMGREVEHSFVYLLVISTSSFKNCLLNSFVHLLVGFLVLLEFSFFELLIYSCY